MTEVLNNKCVLCLMEYIMQFFLNKRVLHMAVQLEIAKNSQSYIHAQAL